MNRVSGYRPEDLSNYIDWVFIHMKGRPYRLLHIATHSETGETVVVYQALYGVFDVYVRPIDSFNAEVSLTDPKNTAGNTYRFQPCSDSHCD